MTKVEELAVWACSVKWDEYSVDVRFDGKNSVVSVVDPNGHCLCGTDEMELIAWAADAELAASALLERVEGEK